MPLACPQCNVMVAPPPPPEQISTQLRVTVYLHPGEHTPSDGLPTHPSTIHGTYDMKQDMQPRDVLSEGEVPYYRGCRTCMGLRAPAASVGSVFDGRADIPCGPSTYL